MHTFYIKNIKETDFTALDILSFLMKIDKDYDPPISTKVNLEIYAHKIFLHADIIIIYEHGADSIGGLISFYSNQEYGPYSYIPVIGVLKNLRGRGYAKHLLAACFECLNQKNINLVKMQTWSSNPALKFYKKLGFDETSRLPDRPNGVESVHLEYCIK